MRNTLTGMQTSWNERIKTLSNAEQDRAEIDTQQDKIKLMQITDTYRQLYQLISITVIMLVAFSLICFFAFRYGFLSPLSKLEKSSRELLENDLTGHIWGLDRSDGFGSLARSIANIRKATIGISDMVVETERGEQHVRFEGSTATIFSALISDLQKTVNQLTEHSSTLETVGKAGHENLVALGETTTRRAQSLEEIIVAANTQMNTTHSEWSDKLSTLFYQNNQIQGQSKDIVEQFKRDMHSLNEIAAATGTRVAQTLQVLSASDRDIKKAAQQSLEASNTFAVQASDLTQKLQAATNLLRASGKVMSETTDTARMRLNEAINSVSSHDHAIRAFLGDTEEKTDRITSLLEDVSRSAVHASETISVFDNRMASFEEKSNSAFYRIEQSGEAIGNASVQLHDVNSMMHGSLDAMNNHTEALAHVLISIRDEYSSFSNEWKNNLAETDPILKQLKLASNTLQSQLQDEWTGYAQQSRQLLTALEQDVRAMNTRTEQVTKDTEKLIGHLSEQTQRVSDNANHFDLQIANISIRLDDAATSVLHSNEKVLNTTHSQIEMIHNSVQDMTQRLSILSQLTGTLGAVAGQLGQIVPTLGDAGRMSRAALPFADTANPAILAKFEELSTGFSDTVNNIKGEFDGVRGQISRWVEMLTNGYKNLADQINAVDGSIEAKITALKGQLEYQLPATASAPAINLGEELVPAMRLIHEELEKGYAIDAKLSSDLQQLKNDLSNMAGNIHNTSTSLQQLGTMVEHGFERIDELKGEPVTVTVDATRVESAAQMLERLLATLQGQSNDVADKLSSLMRRLETAPALGTDQTAAPLAPLDFSEKANLDQLQHQIENISAMLDQFSTDGPAPWLAWTQPCCLAPSTQRSSYMAAPMWAFISFLFYPVI
ncbi:MAG: methyl-accepting chemotaxis protein [Alphaproteobacteria bacterium]|nr:methyl-accepting chemotaxis protein [Alphaproteobacteria bacterium]